MKKILFAALIAGTFVQADDTWAAKERMCLDTYVSVGSICGVFGGQLCRDTFIQNWPKIKYSCKETMPGHYNKYRQEMKKMGQL